MNEVEKMYKLADVQPQYKKRVECKEGHQVGQPCGKSPCIDCDKSVFEDVMPPFTAEKQLELIKWLMCKKQTIQVELRLYENDYCISHITEYEDNDAIEYVETGRKNTFEEALAESINHLWQDLTEEERKQIKEVLNG